MFIDNDNLQMFMGSHYDSKTQVYGDLLHNHEGKFIIRSYDKNYNYKDYEVSGVHINTGIKDIKGKWIYDEEYVLADIPELNIGKRLYAITGAYGYYELWIISTRLREEIGVLHFTAKDNIQMENLGYMHFYDDELRELYKKELEY